MPHWKILLFGLIWLVGLGGCAGGDALGGPQKSQDQVLDAVWADLDAYTSSHRRENWLAKEVSRKRGDQAAREFEGKPFSCIRPQPPANQPIEAGIVYWYVIMAPRPVTPSAPRLSPTAPPAVPEPTLFQALYLVHPSSGSIIARKISCVIY